MFIRFMYSVCVVCHVYVLMCSGCVARWDLPTTTPINDRFVLGEVVGRGLVFGSAAQLLVSVWRARQIVMLCRVSALKVVRNKNIAP